MAAATAPAAAAQQPVSAQVVGNAFVQQYYHIQHQSPRLVHRFYQDISKLGRPDGDGGMTTTTTMQAIDEKILSLNYVEFRAEIKSVDAQESYNGGVQVLVTGYLLGKDNMIQNFTQTFFLAPQEKGYFVLNDIFRYVEDIKPQNGNQSSGNDIEAPLTPEQDIRLCYQIQARNKDRQRQTNENRGRRRRTRTDRDRRRLLMAGEDVTTTNRGQRSPYNNNRDPSPEQENHVSEQTVAPVEVNGDEDVNTSDNGGVLVEEEEVPMAEVVDEEVPVAEVVDEVPDDSQVVVESNSKIEEVPKKSYASITFLGFASVLCSLVALKLLVKDHNYFFLASESIHVTGIMVLIYKLATQTTCYGLSLKTQELTAIFLSVRLYCSFVIEGDIHTLLDFATLVSTVWVIYMIRFKLKSTYTAELDNLAIYYMVIPCAILAMVIHPYIQHSRFCQILWAFCVYLESVSVLPQLRLIQNAKMVEPFTAHYVFALGASRFLGCAHWIIQVYDTAGKSVFLVGGGYFWPPMVLLSEIVRTFILADFCYYYVKSVMNGRLLVSLPPV